MNHARPRRSPVRGVSAFPSPDDPRARDASPDPASIELIGKGERYVAENGRIDRRVIEAEITLLIDMLDAYDALSEDVEDDDPQGQPDDGLEPSLGWVGDGPQSLNLLCEGDDLELDDCDLEKEEDSGADDEQCDECPEHFGAGAAATYPIIGGGSGYL